MNYLQVLLYHFILRIKTKKRTIHIKVANFILLMSVKEVEIHGEYSFCFESDYK